MPIFLHSLPIYYTQEKKTIHICAYAYFPTLPIYYTQEKKTIHIHCAYAYFPIYYTQENYTPYILYTRKLHSVFNPYPFLTPVLYKESIL